MYSHDIKIKSKGIDLPQSVVNYIYDKIGSLKKLAADLSSKDIIDIDVEIGRITQHHRQGLVYSAKCNFVLPGKILRAEHIDWDVRRCIDEIKNELQQKIKKYMTKIRPQDSSGQKKLRKLRGKL